MSFHARFLSIVLAVTLTAYLVVIYLRPQPQEPTSRSEATTPEAVLSQHEGAPHRQTAAIPQTSPMTAFNHADDPALQPPPLALDASPLSWERQLAHITTSQTDAATKARTIFAQLPRLPEEALAAATEQAIKDLPDASYAGVALPIVTNPNTHGQAMSVLFADLMERPDPIALPALLIIARNPNHPFAASALDDLELVLRENHGSDWPKWQASIEKRLTPKPR